MPAHECVLAAAVVLCAPVQAQRVKAVVCVWFRGKAVSRGECVSVECPHTLCLCGGFVKHAFQPNLSVV